MISKYDFEYFIDNMRTYKAFMTQIIGNYRDDYTFCLVQELYDGILESFINATVNDMTYGFVEMIDAGDEDSISLYTILNEYIDYGYTYAPQIKERPSGTIDDFILTDGVLLNNINDFYNYWVLFELPENPIYKNYSFNSDDSKKIAEKYNKEIQDRCFPINYFII